MIAINNHKKNIAQVIVILSIIFFYDTLIDILLWLIHAIFELIYTLFEIIEQTLDLIVEHLFNTSLHATQIIVFYIMLSICCFVAFKIIKVFFIWYNKSIDKYKCFLNRMKLTRLYYSEKLFLLENIRHWLIIIMFILLAMFSIF